MNKNKVYDDLRNGLLHKYATKRKVFTIYEANSIMTDQQMLDCAKCGIIFDRKGDPRI